MANGFILKKYAGFTLLELLVVVAIIGFLSSVSIVALTASQKSGRDQERRLAQLTIIKAVELYTTDFGAPPVQFCVGDDGCQPINFDTTEHSNKFVFLNAAYAARQQITCDEDGLPSGCTAGGPGGGGPSGPVCGDGTIGDTEDCDDGNTVNGDGCSSGCGYEDGWSCTPRSISPTVCAPICGDGIIVDSELCDDGVSNGVCPAACSDLCTLNSCSPGGGPSCGDGICDAGSGENLNTCPADCIAGGSTPGTCGTGTCDAGENPGNCGEDCQDLSMCYIGGQWNLCCLFGDDYCKGTDDSRGAGYYGVCLGSSCQQRYLLEPPEYQCASDIGCTPPLNNAEKFVPDRTTNWLVGLERYLANIPFDPGKHNFTGVNNSMYNKYYTSSHPDIVHDHGLCVWVSLERQDDNFNPYVDILIHPTSDADGNEADLYWTVLCQQ